MIRAIHEWCIDNGCTPHLLVVVDSHTRVPLAYVKNGEIVLNVNYTATKDLQISNDVITFSARFGGVSQNLYVPMNSVKGIFARENGQGMFFENGHISSDIDEEVPTSNDSQGRLNEENKEKSKKPTLTIVK